MSKFKVPRPACCPRCPVAHGQRPSGFARSCQRLDHPDNVDRPKISAGDRDFGNKDIFGILSGGIVNWDETDPGTRSVCPKFTPWIGGILYVNNLAWQSTRVEVDYHDFKHNELYTWDSATFTPVDNKKHEYVISDAVYGSEDVDHIIIKIDAPGTDVTTPGRAAPARRAPLSARRAGTGR
jgi:hypothetical protein